MSLLDSVRVALQAGLAAVADLLEDVTYIAAVEGAPSYDITTGAVTLPDGTALPMTIPIGPYSTKEMLANPAIRPTDVKSTVLGDLFVDASIRPAIGDRVQRAKDPEHLLRVEQIIGYPQDLAFELRLRPTA